MSFLLQNIFIPSLFDFRPITMFVFCLILTPLWVARTHSKEKFSCGWWRAIFIFCYTNFIFLFSRTQMKSIQSYRVAYIHAGVVVYQLSWAAIKIVLFCVWFQGYFYVHSHQSISHIFFLTLFNIVQVHDDFLAFSLFPRNNFVDWLNFDQFWGGFRVMYVFWYIAKLNQIFHHSFLNKNYSVYC